MDKKEGEASGLVVWFSELTNKDIAIAGGKGASLAEMSNNGFPIPPGFVVSANAYSLFIEKAGIKKIIHELLEGLDVNDGVELEKIAKKIREVIISSKMPLILEEAIVEAYEILDVDKREIHKAREGALAILKTGHEPPFVAVRSSATAEDLADASFAGQQESFLNVKGSKELVKKVKECIASLFTARAIYYRTKKKFSHENTKLAVVVQKMVDSDKSGVIFSKNPVKRDGSILIEAVWGLGEGIVSGKIKPDQYIIDGNIEKFNINELNINEKKIAIVRDSAGNNSIVKLTQDRSEQQVLTSYEIKRLAQYANKLEVHYGKPQDIEFAIEGNNIYIVQSRPITAFASDEKTNEVIGDVLLSGLGASPGIASGVVKIIYDMEDLSKIKQGDVLVTKMTNPDMVVTMQKAAAIITDEGGVTSHAAIVSREMGIPAVVGTGNATEKLEEGILVSVDGGRGKVYAGRTEAKTAEIELISETKTKIKVIVDMPEFAYRAARCGAKSVGLVRLEGIIASKGKHPLWFIKENKINEYIGLIAEGLKKIAEPFEEIWIRTSDIRSDEYRHLIGASKEIEGNPMLGDHGIRFGLRHPQLIKAEISAIKEVGDEFPNKKFGIMMPQVIDVKEIKEVKRIANEEVVLPNNIKIGIMVETPAAIQLINKFCEEGIKFVSFGSNDLTQYTLAIDRNNSDVQYLYDEMHPAVLHSLSYAIRRCKYYGVETSICGQAGSREDMVRFLVKEGIDSVSVNADAAGKISRVIASIEKGEVINEGESKKEIAKEKIEVIEEKKEEAVKIEKIEDMAEEKEEVIVNAGDKDIITEKMGEDIEEVILKELDAGEDYEPGSNGDDKKDIPPLNEAMPIEQEDLKEEEKEDKAIDVF